MDKIRVGYLLQGSIELDAKESSPNKVLEQLKYDVPARTLVDGVLSDQQGIDPEHIFLASVYKEGGNGECEAIFDRITAQDVEELSAIASAINHRAFRVWKNLTMALKEVVLGQRDIETAFNQIDIRDCVKQHQIVATTWHIDDIRDRYPFGTSDKELFDELRKFERVLSNLAVSSGHDVIADSCTVKANNEVYIQEAWAVRYGEKSFASITTVEEEIRIHHPGAEIVKGYTITGGSSIEQFIEENFLAFYEDKQDLMETILNFPGMNELVEDLSLKDDHMPSVEEISVKEAG